MPFIINKPVNISRVLCNNTTGNYNNTATLFNPANKFITVIAFISKNQFASQIEWFQQSFRKTDIVTISTRENKP